MDENNFFQTTIIILLGFLMFFDLIGLIHAILSTKFVRKKFFKKNFPNIKYVDCNFWRKKFLDNWLINISIYIISLSFHICAIITYFSK